jgi:hypothetical protein
MKQAKINRVDGWRFLHRALDENEWIITNNCVHAVRAIPSLIYDEKKNNEDVLKTATMYDDVADELRYGLYSQAHQKEVPIEEQIRQRASSVKDITSRNILIMKLKADVDRGIKNKGVVASRSIGRFRRYGS